jgi:hypothetical protein
VPRRSVDLTDGVQQSLQSIVLEAFHGEPPGLVSSSRRTPTDPDSFPAAA